MELRSNLASFGRAEVEQPFEARLELELSLSLHFFFFFIEPSFKANTWLDYSLN